MKESYHEQPEKERQRKKESYQKEPEKVRQRMRDFYQRQQAIQFANADERTRYIKFKMDLRDYWSYACVCCHRMIPSLGGGRSRHFSGGIKTLKDQLTDIKKGLFEESIKMPLPKEVHHDGKIYLCGQCRKYFFVKKKRPPLCYYNGLECEDIPPELQLTDLESVLIAKRILFLKVCI